MPHAWPAGLLPERKQAIRQCLEKHGLAIANVNAFMMNAVADPRQPYWHPSWIEPDPHYRAIRREHTKRALALAKELGAPSIQTEPGGPLSHGQTWQAAAKIFYDELMPCVELAQRLEVLLLIEPEPGLLVERFEQYLEFAGRVDSPVAGAEFRHRPRLLRGRGPAGLDRPYGPPHKTLSRRGHRRHPRATSTWFPGGGQLTLPPSCGKLPVAATKAGSPWNCIPTSTIPTPPAARHENFWKGPNAVSRTRRVGR